jgi:hypothetical protein
VPGCAKALGNVATPPLRTANGVREEAVVDKTHAHQG